MRNVAVIGNKKYSTDELLGELKLKGNDYFNQAKMTADVSSLQDKYGGVGYVFADVKADPRFLEDPAQLDLVYNIKEGDRYRVGKINVHIKGDYPHTQITTILNRLSIHPGDVVDIREIRASERRIKASGLFESNPASGNAPKIVFSPPGQETKDEDDDSTPRDKDKSAAGRKGGRSAGRGGLGRGMGGNTGDDPNATTFRGQSPDPDPRDRKLDVTLDCGRYIGPRDEGRGAGDEGRDEPARCTPVGQTFVSAPETPANRADKNVCPTEHSLADSPVW